MLARAEAQQERRAAAARARGRTAAAPPRRGQAPRLARAPRAGSADEVDHRQRRAAARRAIDLHRPARRASAKVVRSASWRRDDLAERGAERRHVERPVEAQGRRHVVDGAARLQLVEEPEPLLGEGERQAARRAGGTGTSGGAAVPSRARRAAPRPRAASPATVGASNSARSGSSTPSALAQPRHHLGGEQRVAAELEEVVVHADPLAAASTSAQIPASSSSTGVRGAGVRRRGARGRLRRRQGACGPPCRWASSGSACERHEGRRHHVLGQPLAPGTRAAPPQLRPATSPRPARRRPPARRSPAAAGASRATTAASRTAGCAASAASISPSSMRKPRTLTWWSIRPRNSSSPSGRQRARSPVR